MNPEEVALAEHNKAPRAVRGDRGRGDADTYVVGGLNLNLMVGAEGLEPPTASL